MGTDATQSFSAREDANKVRILTRIWRYTAALVQGAGSLIGVMVAMPGHVYPIPHEFLLKRILHSTPPHSILIDWIVMKGVK